MNLVTWALFLTFAGLHTPAPDALTELELVLKENVRLQKALARSYEQTDACRMELAPVIKAKNDAAVAKAESELKVRIEAAHPGHAYDVETGRLERKAAPTEKTPPKD